MAKNTQLTNAVVNAQADALAALLDHGYLRIYNGSQPASGDTALGSQTMLVELRLATPAAPAAVNGVLTFSAIAAAAAAASGTASWFRIYASDGTTPVMDGSVGVSGDGPNLTLSSTTIASGGVIAVTAFTHTVSKSATGY